MELLGIDIGGSGIKGAIVDAETGELVSERKRTPRVIFVIGEGLEMLKFNRLY